MPELKPVGDKFHLHADGEFVRERIVGGDETIGTAGIKLPAHGYDLTHDKNNMSIQKVRLYPHPPREDGAVQEALS